MKFTWGRSSWVNSCQFSSPEPLGGSRLLWPPPPPPPRSWLISFDLRPGNKWRDCAWEPLSRRPAAGHLAPHAATWVKQRARLCGPVTVRLTADHTNPAGPARADQAHSCSQAVFGLEQRWSARFPKQLKLASELRYGRGSDKTWYFNSKLLYQMWLLVGMTSACVHSRITKYVDSCIIRCWYNISHAHFIFYVHSI